MDTIKQKLNESAFMRWSMLGLIAFVTFATYFVNDIFSGMKGILETNLGIASGDVGFILGSVAIFNMLGMIMVGGAILDRFGVVKTGFALIGLASLGSLLIAYANSAAFADGGFGYSIMQNYFPGDYSPQVKMILLGRILFGMGLETCCVMVQKVIVKWFKGKELALAFAINMGVGRLGTSFALWLPPELAGDLVNGVYPQLSAPLWFGFIFSGLAMLVFFIYTIYDVRLDKQTQGDKAEKATVIADKKEAEEAPVVKKKTAMEWFRTTSLYHLLTNKAFLFITALCVTYYAAVFPFIQVATDMLVNKFGFALKDASKIMGVFPLLAIVFTISFGRLVDKKGKSATLMIWGSGLLIFSHLTLSLTMLPPYLALLALEVAFALVPAAMWPAVAKIISEKRLGLAYSFMFTIQNIGLFFIPILIGKVLEWTNPDVTAELINAGKASYNYTYPILMMAILGFMGLFFAFMLKREDKKIGYGLENPAGLKDDN